MYARVTLQIKGKGKILQLKVATYMTENYLSVLLHTKINPT